MKRTACILGEPTGWHARRLASLLSDRGFESTIVPWRTLSAEVTLRGDRFAPREFAEADVVVVRGMPGTSTLESRLEEVIFRMDALARLAATGTPVINPPRALEVAIDKYLSLTLLAAAGVAVPRTIIAQDPTAAIEAWESLGRDCLAKPLFGSRGRGIVRCQSAETAAATIETHGGVAYLQEFVPHAGRDIRALVVGERVFAMERHAPPGHWLTNLAQGGVATPVDLSPEVDAMARRAAFAVGAPLAGVDLVQAIDGRVLVIEVNAVPGWQGIEGVVGPAAGEAIAEHVAGLARM